MSAATGNLRLTPAAALQALADVPQGPPFRTLLRRGSLEVEIYKPVGEDLQMPHPRDEIYVVIAGRGEFVCDGARQPFEPGEVLFVPAGVTHRFENFSEDFSTWVLFFGPHGGERRDEPDA